MRAVYGHSILTALVSACLLIQPLDDAAESDGIGGSAGTQGTPRGTGGFAQGGAGGSCGLSFTNPCLDSCANRTCCSAVKACLGNRECADTVVCATSCTAGDVACAERCVTEHERGASLFNNMLDCINDCGRNPGDPTCFHGAGGTSFTITGSGAQNCETSAKPDAARVKACVYDVGCDPLVPAITLSQCVVFGPGLPCSEGAQSCADINACKRRRTEAPDVCLETEFGWTCDGNVAINCDSAPPYSIDCAQLGAVCDVIEYPDVSPDLWPCRLSTPSSCSDLPGESRCSGNAFYTCVDNQPYGVDCTKWGQGQVCVEPEPGRAYCTDRTETCSDPSLTCEGNSIKYCDDDNLLGVYDCTLAGATCSAGNCLSPGCTPEHIDNCQESCTSDTLMRICVAGAPYTIDCSEYGFAECVTFTDHPLTGGTYVACR